jgi:hypothetical protein
MAKSIRAVRTIAMKPNSTMCTHDDHAVNNEYDQQRQRKEFEQKEKKKRQHAHGCKPIDKGYPILFCFENIDARKCFGIQLL